MNDNEPKEPSVLDYLKSKLSFGRRPKIEIPDWSAESETESAAPEFAGAEAVQLPAVDGQPFPWLSLVCVGLALLAQGMFEPSNPAAMTGIAFYVMALAFLLCGHPPRRMEFGPVGRIRCGQ